MVSNQQSVEPRTEPLVGRRAITRTVAHAAWALPAIQIAAAAPAYAATSTTTGIQNPNVSLSQDTTNGATKTPGASGITVTNPGPNPLAANTVLLTLTINGGNANTVWGSPTVSPSTSNWVYLSGVGTKNLVFSWNAIVPVGTSVPLSGTVSGSLPNVAHSTVSAALSFVG